MMNNINNVQTIDLSDVRYYIILSKVKELIETSSEDTDIHINLT